MDVSQVIVVDTAEQHGGDSAQLRIVGATHRAAGIIENPRAVRVLEDQRPVENGEFAPMPPAAFRGRAVALTSTLVRL